MIHIASTATALSLALIAPALAQDTTTSDTLESADSAGSSPEVAEQLIRVTTLLDGDVYAAEADSGGNVGEPLLEVPATWSEIGEIEDIALSPDGSLRGIVIDIGGFLGLGETTVLVPAEELRSVRVGSEVYFLTTMTEEALRELPRVDDTLWQ